tara:strand:+ start:2064 stop:2417 length:354 start_codon:yes stop_codon:yes gene_type:complete
VGGIKNEQRAISTQTLKQNPAGIASGAASDATRGVLQEDGPHEITTIPHVTPPAMSHGDRKGVVAGTPARPSEKERPSAVAGVSAIFPVHRTPANAPEDTRSARPHTQAGSPKGHAP